MTYALHVRLNDGKLWGPKFDGKPHKFCKPASGWGLREFCKEENMTKTGGFLDQEGALTVVCDMEIFCKNRMKSKDVKLPYEPFSLSDELQMAAGSKDVTITCNFVEDKEPRSKKRQKKDLKDNEIRCHKLILTTRSDVFAAMFSHDHTSESQTNTIAIDDTPMSVLQEFVNYLYTDKSDSLMSDNVKSIGDMLRLADKYNVLSLKQRCENRLLQLIKGATIGEIYPLAYLYNCEPVGKAVASYVAENLNDAFKSKWMASFSQDMQDKIMKDVWTQKLTSS